MQGGGIISLTVKMTDPFVVDPQSRSMNNTGTQNYKNSVLLCDFIWLLWLSDYITTALWMSIKVTVRLLRVIPAHYEHWVLSVAEQLGVKRCWILSNSHYCKPRLLPLYLQAICTFLSLPSSSEKTVGRFCFLVCGVLLTNYCHHRMTGRMFTMVMMQG